MKTGFLTDDEFGLVPEVKVPYYAIKLTPEQAKIVGGKIPQIYEADGHQVFDIKKDKDAPSEGKMLYVIWV